MMTWIKRNLFFVIGGVLALGLLGAAGFYDYTSWERNSAAFDKLNEVYNTLRQLRSQQPSPGNDKINNIEAAKQQEAQLRDWIRQARSHFRPITPVPIRPMARFRTNCLRTRCTGRLTSCSAPQSMPASVSCPIQLFI